MLLDPNTLSADGTVALAGTLGQRRRHAAGLRPGRGRLRLAGVAGPRRRDRPRPRRPAQVDQVLRGARGPRTARGFFYGRFPEPETRRGPQGGQLLPEALLTTRSARRRPTTGSSTSGPTRRNGSSTAASPTTAGTWSSPSPRGPTTSTASSTSPLDDPTRTIVELIDNFDADYTFIDNDGPVFWFKTDQDAPARPRDRHRHARARARSTGRRSSPRPTRRCDERQRGRRPVPRHVPEGRAHRRSRSSTSTARFVREVELPGLGTAAGFGGKRTDTRDVLRLHLVHDARRRSTATTSPPARAPSSASPRSTSTPTTTRPTQVFYPSKDGTRIPMFISHKKGLEARRQDPDPALRLRRVQHLADARRSARATWSGWRWGASTPCPTCAAAASTARSGTRPARSSTKQNVFDDFIAAAEWLIANRYTSTPQAGHRRRLQRRPAGRRLHDAAARPLRRGPAGRRRDGHAALPQVHDRLGLGRRLRLVRRPRAVQGAARLFAPAQHQAGHLLPADPDHHRRPRRPRRARRTASSSPRRCRRPRRATTRS